LRTGTDAAGLETEVLRLLAHPGWKFARLSAGGNRILTLGPRRDYNHQNHRVDGVRLPKTVATRLLGTCDGRLWFAFIV
jgi:hypothetical protein